MKKIFIFSVLIAVFFSCDYYYDDYYYDETTDFSKDISNKQNFYFSTPVALSILESKVVNDTAYYKVGDTLKLSLNLNSIYQENATDSYNLFKSTKATSFYYSLHRSDEIDSDIINLKVIEKYPELTSGELTEEEIQTSPYYKDLYINHDNIKAVLNTETNIYESKIGLVLKKPTGFYDNYRYPLYISTSSYVSNDNYEANSVIINIPIFSSISKSVVYINE